MLSDRRKATGGLEPEDDPADDFQIVPADNGDNKGVAWALASSLGLDAAAHAPEEDVLLHYRLESAAAILGFSATNHLINPSTRAQLQPHSPTPLDDVSLWPVGTSDRSDSPQHSDADAGAVHHSGADTGTRCLHDTASDANDVLPGTERRSQSTVQENERERLSSQLRMLEFDAFLLRHQMLRNKNAGSAAVTARVRHGASTTPVSSTTAPEHGTEPRAGSSGSGHPPSHEKGLNACAHAFRGALHAFRGALLPHDPSAGGAAIPVAPVTQHEQCTRSGAGAAMPAASAKQRWMSTRAGT